MPGAGMTDAEQWLSKVGGTPTSKQTNTFLKKHRPAQFPFEYQKKKKKDYQLTKSYVEKQEHNGLCSASKEEEKGQKSSRSSLTKVKKRCWQTPVLQHQSH